MGQRFFKLLYVFALIALLLSAPIYLLQEIRFDAIVNTTYRAKCISNDQYVVLQGAEIGEVYEFDELVLNDPFGYSDTKRTLNFYCRYYDQIQPHIVAFAQNPNERGIANARYFEFRNPIYDSVPEYPPLYKLEVVSEEFQSYELINPIVSWLIGALMAFILLQIARMSYAYVVFGEVVWHPFKQRKAKRHD